jgi:hypothetical protein
MGSLHGPQDRRKKANGSRKEPLKRREPWKKRGLSRADRVITFLQTLPITKGVLVGKKMKLLPGQRRFVQAIYGRLDIDGRRQIRIAIKSEYRAATARPACWQASRSVTCWVLRANRAAKYTAPRGGHPILRWQISNVAIEQDPAGNRKCSKKRASGHIDGVIALLMAMGQAAKTPPPRRSVYETARYNRHFSLSVIMSIFQARRDDAPFPRSGGTPDRRRSGDHAKAARVAGTPCNVRF